MNPQQMLNLLMSQNPNFKNNPMANNALQMLQNGNTQGLKELAQQIANQKGVNLEDIRKQIGM